MDRNGDFDQRLKPIWQNSAQQCSIGQSSAVVKNVLKKACNDCHSNYTNYPWYCRIQPVGWWIQHHVNEGKHHLNFSDFASYTQKRQVHKLNDMAEVMEEGEMPLSSYTLIHKEAKLTDAENKLLAEWAKNLSHQINPSQTEKEEPQPHFVVAFGFSITNCSLIICFLYDTVEPLKYSAE